MTDWTDANLKLRADRDAMNEVKRREAAAEPAVTPSCGNVFADLGLPEADDLLAEAGRRHREGIEPRLSFRPVDLDCGCTAGTLCRHNNACPRVKARKASQQRDAQRLHRITVMRPATGDCDCAPGEICAESAPCPRYVIRRTKAA